MFYKCHIHSSILADSDSDSDAYCDPESLPHSPQHQIHAKIPIAPQKSLPPPPSGAGSGAEDSDEDSGHDYEDPSEEMRQSAKVLSLRRGSHPVLNPDAYLALQEMELDSTYQDVSPTHTLVIVQLSSRLQRPQFVKDYQNYVIFTLKLYLF